METFKLIRKICLILSILVGVVLVVIEGIKVYDRFNLQFGKHSDPWGEFFLVLLLSNFIYIGVHILFEVISKIIESVKKDTGKMKVFSDKQYLEAYSEVEENNIQNKELWAKAFAQCGGDKEKQKSIYVELRTKELSKG